MRNFFKFFAREALRSTVLLLSIGAVAVIAFAYSEPTLAPTGGTVYAPVNTSGTAQTKSGNFTSSGTLTGNTVNVTSQLCLPGVAPS